MPVEVPPRQTLTLTHWLILIVASLGFAFDIYEVLMMPLVGPPALANLLKVDLDTADGFKLMQSWQAYIVAGSAISGGIFGLLGGYLTDRLGRRRVLVWSILLYAFSALGAAFSTSPTMLLVLRCTTFIGVCVEFVAAVAWLSELFPNPHQREQILGYTQAFSSFGGLMVAVAYGFCSKHADQLPAILGEHAAWRYTLVSGLIPAIPLMLIRPFLPESPAWRERRAAGTLKRPSLRLLFTEGRARTTIVTTLLFACAYGAAFGAIQTAPQIVPSLAPELAKINKLRGDLNQAEKGSDAYKALKDEIKPLNVKRAATVAHVQTFQEVGGLLGRFALAFLAVRMISRRKLLWTFQLPGIVVIFLVFYYAGTGKLGESSLSVLTWGIAAAGFFTIAQLSFWGNYLPQAYPVYLRGTGEGFAANVGGRMLGTLGLPLNTALASWLLTAIPSLKTLPAATAMAAACVGGGAYLLGIFLCVFLPEPSRKTAEE